MPCIGYITITTHFTEDWALKSKLLATRKIDDRHTGENIVKALKSVQEEFDIAKVSALTTDNASNMLVAARLYNVPHVRCFAHSLQLAVHSGLTIPSIVSVVSQCRHLVGHFSHSVIGTHGLEEFQRQQQVPQPLHLIQDVITRWNSTFFMMKRLQKL